MTKLHEIAKSLKVLAESVPAAVAEANEANKAHKNTSTPRDVFRLLGIANQIERLNERAQAIFADAKAAPKAKTLPPAKTLAAPKPAKAAKAAPVAATADDEV